jgi:hypothetical protein
VLLVGAKPARYYNTSGVSHGLQAGAQTYGYALFLMNDTAVASLDKNEGLEVGAGIQGTKITHTASAASPERSPRRLIAVKPANAGVGKLNFGLPPSRGQ